MGVTAVLASRKNCVEPWCTVKCPYVSVSRGEVAVTVHGIGGNSGRQGRSLGGVAIQEIFFKALTVTAVGLKKKCGTIL